MPGVGSNEVGYYGREQPVHVKDEPENENAARQQFNEPCPATDLVLGQPCVRRISLPVEVLRPSQSLGCQAKEGHAESECLQMFRSFLQTTVKSEHRDDFRAQLSRSAHCAWLWSPELTGWWT